MTSNFNANGQEHTLPSYNEDDDAQAQGLQDAAELPFGNGNDAADAELRSSNQATNLFKCNKKIILASIGTTLFLCAVTGISSAALSGSNGNSIVVESFNSAPQAANAKAAKATKAPKCSPNAFNLDDAKPLKTGKCDECCRCPLDNQICDVRLDYISACICGE